LNEQRLRFKLLWVFLYLFTFLKNRGYAGRTQPVSLIFDEISELINIRTADGRSVMQADFERLISVVSRNYGVWTTVAHQALLQCDRQMQSLLMRMGTQIIGNTPDPDDALYLARQLTFYDPYLVKKQEPVWMGLSESTRFSHHTVPTIIDFRDVEFSLEEQDRMAEDKFRQLPGNEFFVRPALAEGDLSGRLKRISLANLDRGQYPDEAELAPLRRQKAQRDGYRREVLLEEIEKRGQEMIAVQTTPATAKRPNAAKKPVTQNGKLKDGDTAHEPQSADLPLPGTRKRTPSPWNRRSPQSSVDGA
jgi:hypothetical protein